MRRRSTRVLKHPDGSFTVEMIVEAEYVEPGAQFAIPKKIKQWVRDPGFAPQMAFGFVGQHRSELAAVDRAKYLSEVPERELYATEHAHFMRPEDVTVTPKENVN